MRVMVIDVGQSGSRLRTPDGKTVRSDICHRADRDLTDTVRLLLEACSGTSVDVVGLSLSGLRGFVPEPHAFGIICATWVGASRVAVADDGLAALFGALGGGDGIALAVGSGVAVVAKADDRTAHKDGDGPVIGDDGGGYGIGRRGLRAALRSAEGRGPATALLALAEERYGSLRAASRAHTDAEVMRWCIDMAEVVLNCAEQGDNIARAIRWEAAQQLAASAAAAWHDLATTRESITFSGTGGVLQNAGMRAALSAAMAQTLPESVWQEPLGDNLDGMHAIACMTPHDSLPLLRWWFAA